MQVAGLAASVAPQVFTLTAKGPLGAIEVMLIAVLFGFDSVTVFADDTVSTVTLPNDSSFGLMPILRPAADAASGAHAKIATRIETTARFPVPIVHLAPPESKSGDVVMMKLQFRSRPPIRLAPHAHRLQVQASGALNKLLARDETAGLFAEST